MHIRLVKETFDRVLKASAALVTAASTSSFAAIGTRATTSFVVGFKTSNQVSVVERTFSTLMINGISLKVVTGLLCR